MLSHDETAHSWPQSKMTSEKNPDFANVEPDNSRSEKKAEGGGYNWLMSAIACIVCLIITTALFLGFGLKTCDKGRLHKFEAKVVLIS